MAQNSGIFATSWKILPEIAAKAKEVLFTALLKAHTMNFDAMLMLPVTLFFSP